jgi:cell division protein FtsL
MCSFHDIIIIHHNTPKVKKEKIKVMDMIDGERVDWRRLIWSKQALGEDKKSENTKNKTGFDKLYGGGQVKGFDTLFN